MVQFCNIFRRLCRRPRSRGATKQGYHREYIIEVEPDQCLGCFHVAAGLTDEPFQGLIRTVAKDRVRLGAAQGHEPAARQQGVDMKGGRQAGRPR